MATVIKTISVKIYEPTKVKEEALKDLLDISTELSKYYVSAIVDLGTYSKKQLHKETYSIVKELFDGMPTGLIQTIRDKAVETYKSYKALLANGKKVSLPNFRNSVVRFDNRTFSLIKTDNCFDYFVSLSTRQKRIMLPIQYGKYQLDILDKINSCEYKFCTAELSFSKRLNSFVLNISYKYDVEEASSGSVMGVDLGVVNFAVLAVPEQIVKFFSGGKYNQKREHYFQLRQALSKKKLLKKVKAIGSKEQRYMKDVNHKLSREIVNIAKAHNSVIQLENLSNIRDEIHYSRKLNRKLHNWNFAQLQSFIEYKAIAEGLKVIYVDNKNTSIQCNVCGNTEKKNRKNRNTFKCKCCGYEANADYNASINISNITIAG